MFSSADTTPMKAAEAQPGRKRVGAGKRRAEQHQEAVEKAMVLDEIARHHRIGHGSGEQLVDEAMPHGIRPGRLARRRNISVKRSDMLVPTYSASLTGCYAPAVPAGNKSKRSAQAYGT